MRKGTNRLLLIMFTTVALFMSITSLTLADHKPLGAFFSAMWHLREPKIYSMELSVSDLQDVKTEWKWRIIVDGGDPVVIEKILETGNSSWFEKYDFTIDGVFEAGKDFCFAIADCTIEFNNVYFYPKIMAYGSKSLIVDNFHTCKTVEECY